MTTPKDDEQSGGNQVCRRSRISLVLRISQVMIELVAFATKFDRDLVSLPRGHRWPSAVPWLQLPSRSFCESECPPVRQENGVADRRSHPTRKDRSSWPPTTTRPSQNIVHSHSHTRQRSDLCPLRLSWPPKAWEGQSTECPFPFLALTARMSQSNSLHKHGANRWGIGFRVWREGLV